MQPNSLAADLRLKYDELRDNYRDRDLRHMQISAARAGDIRQVMPGVFPETWPKPIVANVIDTTAKELAQVLAALPAIDCAPGKAGSDRAKQFAAKKTKIALSYAEHSRLKKQLYSGADWYFTFSAMPIVVEANVFEKMPCMRIDDPRHAYWLTDAYGKVKIYAKEWTETVASLVAKFPDLRDHIIRTKEKPRKFGRRAPKSEPESQPGDMLTVVRMYTKDTTYMFLPDRDNMIVASSKNYLDRVPVEIAELPRWDEESRGTFDDVLWVWLARNRMALLGMEAAKESVQAPIVAGDDVQRIPYGAGAIMRAREPEKIRRLALDIPQGALLESQLLQGELQMGLNKQASASNFDASIVTGRGVEALNGVFSSQIKAAQDDVGDAIRRATMMCFELDEILWPDEQKSISGMANGAPFTETYVPSKDIKGNHSVSVTYGFTAGMDPNRALVWLLQLRGDRAIDRATMQRALPMDIDVEGLGRDIDLERLDDAGLTGIEGLLANLPMMAQQGMDPTTAFQKVAEIRKARRTGKSMGDALEAAFAPKEQPAQPAPLSPEEQALQALEGAGGPEGAAPLSPEQAATGSLGLGAGGAPDIQTLLAGLTGGGNPNLQAGVSRQIPA